MAMPRPGDMQDPKSYLIGILPKFARPFLVLALRDSFHEGYIKGLREPIFSAKETDIPLPEMHYRNTVWQACFGGVIGQGATPREAMERYRELWDKK